MKKIIANILIALMLFGTPIIAHAWGTGGDEMSDDSDPSLGGDWSVDDWGSDLGDETEDEGYDGDDCGDSGDE